MENSSLHVIDTCQQFENAENERITTRTSNNKNYSLKNLVPNTISQRTTTFGTFQSHSNSYEDEKRYSQTLDYDTIVSSLLQSKCKDVDAKIYDPYDYGNADNPTTFWGTVFHLVIISFGPAVLTIPRSFQDVGYIYGFILTFAIVFLYAYNMHMLVWSEYNLCKLKHMPNMSYSDTLYYAIKEGPRCGQWLAQWARYITYIVFIVIWVGCAAFTIVLIGENLQTVYYNSDYSEPDIRHIMIWIIVPLWLLCCIRKLSYLVPFSVAATTINFFCVLVVIYYIIVDPQPPVGGNRFGPIENIPLIAGTVLYNLTATGIIMPLKNEMKNPRKFSSSFGVLTISYVSVSFSYGFFGLLCCLKYGDQLQPSVIQNLPQGEFIAQMTILLSTLTLFFIYPLLSYVVFDVIWNNILREMQTNASYVLFWEYVVRTGVVVASFLAAYIAPNLSLYLAVSGTVGTSIDGIIFPAIMETLVMWRITKDKTKFNRVLYKNLIIMMIAVILIVVGVMNCLNEISSIQ